jgi:hypothetical protein
MMKENLPPFLVDLEAQARSLRSKQRFLEASGLAKRISSTYYALYDQEDYPAEICHPAMDYWTGFARECLNESQKASGRSAVPKAGTVQTSSVSWWNGILESVRNLFQAQAARPPAEESDSLVRPIEMNPEFQRVAAILTTSPTDPQKASNGGGSSQSRRPPSPIPEGSIKIQEITGSSQPELPPNHYGPTPTQNADLLAVCRGRSNDGTLPRGPYDLILWDPFEKKEKALLDQGGECLIGSFTFTTDGRFILVDRVQTIELYSVQSLRRVGKWPTPVPFPYSVDVSPDNRILTIGSARGMVAVYFLEAPSRSFVLEAHLEYSSGFVLDRGKTLVTFSAWQDEVKIWNLETRTLQQVKPMGGNWLAFSAERNWVAIPSGAERLEIRRFPSASVLCEIVTGEPPLSTLSLRSGTILAIIDKNGVLKLFDPEKGILLHPPFQTGVPASHSRWNASSDGKKLLCFPLSQEQAFRIFKIDF